MPLTLGTALVDAAQACHLSTCASVLSCRHCQGPAPHSKSKILASFRRSKRRSLGVLMRSRLTRNRILAFLL